MPVTLRRLGHSFDGTIWLFRDLSIRLDEGNLYALSGPSGSGKSTLLSILAGWVHPSEGEVVMRANATISWVLQNPHGTPRRTARDHVALPLLAAGMAPAAADRTAQHHLERFDLGHVAQRRFSELSGGEAQRLMLARAIARRPDLLLVDEPTAQLDRHTAESVNRVLSAAADERTVVVIATHDHHTREVCSQTIDLQEGSQKTVSEIEP
ncbi:ABC transporter ATP-binding protein [Leifsonia sp. 22587]|uniref:ABC transporter ATP-binding protein n=1 Tax=Leifsonia sp. 22587 TaxID=3453946 RepID=UPI003F83065B